MDQTERLADIFLRSDVLREFVVRRGNGSAKEDAWEIATGLTDILESADRLRELAASLAAPDANRIDVEDVLHAIGEEYRHILYHIQTTKYFGYVQPVDEE
jgi:hypothetical protein